MPGEAAGVPILSKDILYSLEDKNFFIECIAYNYRIISNKFDCDIKISKTRLGEAHSYWREDVARTLRDGIDKGTVELDHFKHASFIAFWLRRTIPINEIDKTSAWFLPISVLKKERRDTFFRFSNEACALFIGYHICLQYESQMFMQQQDANVVKSIQKNITRVEYIRSFEFPNELFRDFVTILKHKSLSPYALYLMYKAMFRHGGPHIVKRSTDS
jgi:hypothetical protein